MKKKNGTLSTIFLLLLLTIQDPLSAQDAHAIHERARVIDMHNDVLISSVMRGKDISQRLTTGHTDLPRMHAGGLDAQFFSVWCGPKYGKGTAFAFANAQIDALEKIIRENPDKIEKATTADDIVRIAGQNKIAALIGVEGGHMIESRIDYLDSLYKRGVRYLTLTWNNSTDWATSASDESDPKANLKHKGLNDKGKAIIRRMNALGMMIDLSHVGEQTFYDAIATSTQPVLVSHSDCYAFNPIPRNIKDDQIRAVKKNGGVVCVNFYSAFLVPHFGEKRDSLYRQYVGDPKGFDKSGDYRFDALPPEAKEALRPPLRVLVDHIDHIVQIAGIDYVGIGADFDGMESTPQGLDDVSDYPKLTQALLERGYSESDIRKIWGENVMRVMRAVTNPH